VAVRGTTIVITERKRIFKGLENFQAVTSRPLLVVGWSQGRALGISEDKTMGRIQLT
jgi:hypothetical protein